MIKRCFIDTETTGLDHLVHAVHQIGVIITDDKGNKLDSLNLMFAPPAFAKCSEEALAKCRLTHEQLFSRPLTQKAAFTKFISFLEEHVNRFDSKDKLQFVAYNSDFDEKFIRAWFFSNSNDFFNSYFWSPSICMQRVAAWYLIDHRDKLERFKLHYVCKFLGIEFSEDHAHDAMYDIEKTLELYRKLN